MDSIITINAGSSSIKFSIYTANSELTCLYKGSIINITSSPSITIKNGDNVKELSETLEGSSDNYRESIQFILKWVKEKKINLIAAGHRVVHGGPFTTSVKVTDDVIDTLTTFIPFSPLHQPYNLKGIALFEKAFPDLYQTVSFDSAFHSTCDEVTQSYALPKDLRDKGIKKYGFHGLSYEYIASMLPTHMQKEQALGKYVVAHLGGGSTLCGIDNMVSVATSIGLTSMGGVPMATRCGDVDPYLAVYLVDNGWSTKKIQDLFYKESGLLGVSQISADMKELLESDDKNAKLAVDIFIHSVTTFTGALAAQMQGIDGFIFTGGIGENSSEIREKVAKNISWIGFDLDSTLNESVKGIPTIISKASSEKQIWVIPTDEEIMIAKHTLNLYNKG